MTKATQYLEKRATENTEIWFDEEGVLWLKPIKEANVDLNEVIACFKIYREMGCDKKKVLQIIDARAAVSMTHEAREYTSKHGNDFFIASAVISNSLAIRLFVNFFNSFYNQPVPFKMFATEKEALKWLRSFRK
jgi:hypothetical protein